MIAVSKEPRCIDFLSPTLREDKDIKKTINQVYEKLALEVSQQSWKINKKLEYKNKKNL